MKEKYVVIVYMLDRSRRIIDVWGTFDNYDDAQKTMFRCMNDVEGAEILEIKEPPVLVR